MSDDRIDHGEDVFNECYLYADYSNVFIRTVLAVQVFGLLGNSLSLKGKSSKDDDICNLHLSRWWL